MSMKSENVVDLLKIYLHNANSSLFKNLTDCVSQLGGDKNLTFLLLEDSSYLYLEDIGSNFSAVTKSCLENLLTKNKFTSQFVLLWWQQIIWTVVFGLMVTIAGFGNAIVIWIVIAHRRMRTITNYFLLNVSLSDLMMATFNSIFNFIFMLHSHWPFGSAYCTINNFIAYLTVSVSVFTIGTTSIDRYIAIVHPLTPRMPKKVVYLLVAVTWISGAALSVPTLLYSTTLTYRYPDGSLRTLCYLNWPDGPAGTSYSDYEYNLFFLVMTYVVPMLTMAFTYSKMCCTLWGSRGIGVETERQRNLIKSKQKVVRMLVVVVLIFAICWLPYHIYFLYTFHFPEVLQNPYVQHVYLAFYWLAMSNSMYNPIIYYLMNNKFRMYFKIAMSCCRLKGNKDSVHRWTRGEHQVQEVCLHDNRSPTLRTTFSSTKSRRWSILDRHNSVRQPHQEYHF
ncbi:tachykinin-like peptides receptor 86C [Limulus polyphemus]|uniref:Tachykinin-like peptides receptor 86C n=1 Tax=Limulus polyphemus TaxID=6850 RepID=A0ABM1B0W6_LIMPO|nr:tachykinin-like peptides receptor 86C [Limulus polyphemus]